MFFEIIKHNFIYGENILQRILDLFTDIENLDSQYTNKNIKLLEKYILPSIFTA